MENLGIDSLTDGRQFNTWPATSTVQGDTGWDYSVDSNGNVALTNNTGSAVNIENARLDVDITVVIPPAANNQGIEVRLTSLLNNIFNVTQFEIVSSVTPTSMTLSLTDLTREGTVTELANGVDWDLSIQSTGSVSGSSSDDETYTVRIDAVRISFTQDEFVRTATSTTLVWAEDEDSFTPFEGFHFNQFSQFPLGTQQFLTSTSSGEMSWDGVDYTIDSRGLPGGTLADRPFASMYYLQTADGNNQPGFYTITNPSGEVAGGSGNALTYLGALGGGTTTPTGIQRITTNLPHHSYRLVHDTRQYWVYINTDTAVGNDISIHLRGQEVDTIDKVGADNLHLGVGDNLFLITLSTTEITNWNTNAISTTPDTQGFEIQDSSGTRIEGIHDQNQFFTGRGEVKETAHFISPDRTQTGTITLNNDGQFVFSAPVRGPDFTET